MIEGILTIRLAEFRMIKKINLHFVAVGHLPKIILNVSFLVDVHQNQYILLTHRQILVLSLVYKLLYSFSPLKHFLLHMFLLPFPVFAILILSNWHDEPTLNTLRPRQNGRHFADDTFKPIFLNENVLISLKISLIFVPKVRINSSPALVQIMAWRRPSDKPLSEPMSGRSLTRICVTRPQWVNWLKCKFRSVTTNVFVSEITLYRETPRNVEEFCSHEKPLSWNRCYSFDHVFGKSNLTNLKLIYWIYTYMYVYEYIYEYTWYSYIKYILSLIFTTCVEMKFYQV